VKGRGSDAVAWLRLAAGRDAFRIPLRANVWLPQVSPKRARVAAISALVVPGERLLEPTAKLGTGIPS
jgi:hypothetical protein